MIIYQQDFRIQQSKMEQIVTLPTNNRCTQIQYIDCRSWYDFSEHIIAISVACFLTYNVMRHYRNLKKQKEDQAQSQHQKSVRRKITVNLIQLFYLFFFIISTILSLYLFFPYQTDKDFNDNHSIPLKMYRISEILYINWLNTLNLTVGFLYWKATRAFYVLSDIQVPFLYRRWFKKMFFIFFCYNISAVVLGICHLFIWKIIDQYFKLFTLIGTLISIGICILCRSLYRLYILKKIDLSQRAIRKQWITSILLCTSSLLRIFLYTFDITFNQIAQVNEWQQKIRNQHQTQTGCIDTSPIYAIILLGIDMIVNLLPAAIYGHLFVSEIQSKYKRKKSSQQKLLKKDSKDSY